MPAPCRSGAAYSRICSLLPVLDLGPVYLDLSVLSAAPPPVTVLREPAVPYRVGVADDLEWAPLGRLREVWEVLGTFAAR